MKSFKRYLKEAAASNNASFASAGSSPATPFTGLAGIGGIAGDTPAANKPGKGDGKDITPEITAAIDAGVKRNSIVQDKETGALQFRGIDGELQNSPHAAVENSRNGILKSAIKSGRRFPYAIGEQILGALKANAIVVTFDKGGKLESADVDPELRWSLWDLFEYPDWLNNPDNDVVPDPDDPGIRPQPRKPRQIKPHDAYPGTPSPGHIFPEWITNPFDLIFDIWDGEGQWRERVRENWDDRYDKLKPQEWKRWQREYGTPPKPPYNPLDPDWDGNPTENPPGSGQWWHHNPPADGILEPDSSGAPNGHPPGWNPSFPPDHQNSPYYVPPVDDGRRG